MTNENESYTFPEVTLLEEGRSKPAAQATMPQQGNYKQDSHSGGHCCCRGGGSGRARVGFFFSLFSSFFGFFIACIALLFLCSVMISGLVHLLGSVDSLDGAVIEKAVAGSSQSPYKIAVLPIDGLIRADEEGFIRKAIRQAQQDEKLVALVLRINTPGGTISGSDYYYYLLKELKEDRSIPIIVSMGGLATSGGYYIAMAGDKIFAERSTMTGSIGVILPLYNASGLCEKIGVSSNFITSGPMKGMGDYTKPTTPEEQKIWQSLVDSGYEQFLDVVKKGRSTQFGTGQQTEDTESGDDVAGDAKLRQIADGRVYTSSQALDLGLVDEIGFLDSAVMCAMKKSNVPPSDIQVVRYKSPTGFVSIFGDVEGMARGNNFSKVLADSITPEPYYLCPGMIPINFK